MFHRLAVFCTMWLALPAVAESAPPQDAAQWLSRMSESARGLNYSGRLVYDRGGELETLEFAHEVVDGVEREQMRYLNGPERRVVREGAHVTCLQGGEARARFERGVPGLRGVAMDRAKIDSLSRFYHFSQSGMDRVAGRSAVVLNVRPLDAHRYGYRLALDQGTGLMLSAYTLAAGDRPLERFKFVQLETAQPAPVEAPAMTAPARQVPQAATAGQVIARAGWLPPGFAELPVMPGERPELNAVMYSDGLAVFSLFVEHMPRSTPPAFVQQGATTLLSRSVTRAGQHYSVTLVGEVPAETAEAVLTGVELGERAP